MKTEDQEKKIELAKAPIAKSPEGVLVIKLEFYEYLYAYDLADVRTSRISNQEIIKDTTEFFRTVAELSAQDNLNVQKCLAFVTTKYPHVMTGFYDFTIDLVNLTPEEIKDCLAQEDMKFTFIKNPDYEG